MHLPPLGLYIHLPWCERKCPYCDFNSHEGKDFPEDDYVGALLQDLRHEQPLLQQRRVETLFIGGGTPSLFSAGSIRRLLQGIADIVRWPPLSAFAYGILGQLLERFLGYVFIAWCIAVVLRDSAGWTRIVGIVALLILMSVEIYHSAVSIGGGTPDTTLKLLYVLVFGWLLLECAKPRAAAL